jgi:pimeloyl-ACP methyl ester carboxylesterase
MKSRKLLLSTTRILVIGYILICMSLFFFQEKFIFFPEKLDRDFIFRFDQRFDEIRIPMKDGKLLHGLLFKADPSKGLIFYLTNKYIKDCQMPVAIFHGDQDEVIYYKSSLKLKPLLKESDTLITLRGQGHNGMTDNVDYIDSIAKILR